MSYTIKPHVRVAEFLGGTGAKNEIASDLIIEGVGSTNSTLTESLMVFITEYTNKMVIAARRDDNVFTRNQFTKIKDLGKVLMFTVGKDDEIKTLIKNSYRVLLTRAREAMYVFIEAPETYNYVKSLL